MLLDEARLPKPLRNRLLRALEWMGDSVMRARVDDKIVDLCTALETLLATKQDRMKGEAITLRMMLLSDLLQELSYLPHQILEIYEKRSSIVHGSERDISTHDDYKIMRRIVIDVLGKVLRYIEKYDIKKHSTFIRGLGKEEQRVRNAVSFWRKQYGEYLAEDIEKAAGLLISESMSYKDSAVDGAEDQRMSQ